MTDDSTRNPEADTFSYIQLLVESLNKMDRLDIAVDAVEQRLPVELFKVVEKSNNEVAQRHPSILRAYANQRTAKSYKGADNDELRTALLNDLLWTLYARFEAIAESHRVVHDVVSGIVRREGLRESSGALTRGFKGLWELYQNEVRTVPADGVCLELTLGTRCALFSTTTSPRMVILATEAANARTQAAVPFPGHRETGTSACLDSQTWT